jgi:hypothetical protein
MDRRRKILVAVAVIAPLLISVALPFVSGCGDGSGDAPVVQRTVKHTTSQGSVTKVEYNDGTVMYRRGNGPEYGRGSGEFGMLEAEFNTSGKALDSASRAAAAERDKGQVLAPVETGTVTQPGGPKVNLPTQHTPTYQPPSTPTPPAYQPPSGGQYHPH